MSSVIEKPSSPAPPDGLRPTSLKDVFTLDRGAVFMSGTQALARLPMLQAQRDARAGLQTRGFISGYRGSPLAGYDLVLGRAQALLDQHGITFMPAINEELAATAIIGTQEVSAQPDVNCDGVFSLWYGKGPGLDRAADALKHANSIGTSPKGGALIVVGDDHNAISSALAHQSEYQFASLMMPVLQPASIAEIPAFGLLGWAMSRFSGCYVGLKLESESIESAASLRIDIDDPRIVLPPFDFPPGGVHYRWPQPQLEAESLLHGFKLPAALAFAAANAIDRQVLHCPQPRIGIVTTGKAYLAVRQALAELGVDDQRAAQSGLVIYKVGMPWPLETAGAREFATGLEEVLVVEEKRGLIEGQLKEALFHEPDSRRPRLIGKSDERGNPLLPSTGILPPELIAEVINRRWPDLPPADRSAQYFARLEQQKSRLQIPAETRPPFFCSGCPHNRSTVPPEGSRVLAGTGCHLMSVFMNRNTSGFLHMGAEGANWTGQAPFCRTSHIFQNLGDGTYTHSGSLAIRQAVAADVNMTYRILHNDAVAMTGGQAVEGGLSVPRMTRQLHAEGVRRIAVVSDEPHKYPPDVNFAPGVTIHDRGDLAAVEKELSSIAGVTALVYDQVCAAEKRRRKRRVAAASMTPIIETRVFINEAVCEGCGDCVVKSNCISVVPKATPLGMKRQIDQSSCNMDMSCLEGFCPSFVTVTGAQPEKVSGSTGGRLQAAVDALPEPACAPISSAFDMVITGVGGQGVVTVGRIAGMAAHLQGLSSTVLDFPGLAQKGGGVMSYVRLTAQPGAEQSARVPPGGADVLVAGDMVTALDRETVGRVRSGSTQAFINSHVSPTGANVLDPGSMIDGMRLRKQIREAVGSGGANFVDASTLSERLSGDAITANIFLLGYACQSGALPIHLDAFMQAIRLNGAAVESNLRCFGYGRLAAHDPAMLQSFTGPPPEDVVADEITPLDELIRTRFDHLVDYQNRAYAQRFQALVDSARNAVMNIEAPDGAGEGFIRAVARGLFQLMAYKDEYEIARLFSSGAFKRDLQARFAGDFKIAHHLAPPLLSRRDKQTGHLRKRKFGPWINPLMGLLARFSILRGTPLDVFGYTNERRRERQRIKDYERRIRSLIGSLSPQSLEISTQVAALASTIRGFGHIKDRNAELAEFRMVELMNRLTENRGE